jgi:hypothetical protein
MELSSPELLKNWRIYVSQNNVKAPTLKDLVNFLKSAGLSDDLIELSVKNQIDLSTKKPEAPIEKPQQGRKFSDDQKERYFYEITKIIKKLNKAQIQDLIRELNDV